MQKPHETPESPPLRVALWAPKPPPVGGVGRWTERFLIAAARHGLTAELINTAPPVHGFSERSAFRVDRLAPAGRAFVHLARLLRQRRIDIAHVTTTYLWALPRDALAVALCNAAGIPAVLHIHAGNQFVAWCESMAPWRLALLKEALRRPAHVIVIARDVAAWFARVLPEVAVSLVPNPVELEAPPSGPRVLPPASRRVRVLFVGAVTPMKGVGDLARAILPLDHVELAVIGERGAALDQQAQRQMDDALAALAARGRLIDVGEVPSDAVLRAYREADIFALASYREGLPNVLLEAMAAGLPCLATPVGGIADILTDAGVLVPVADIVAWREAIDALARSPKKRAALGQAARARVEATCGTDQVMAGYRAVYRAAMAR